MSLASLPVSHSAGASGEHAARAIIDENKDNRPRFRSNCAQTWHARTCTPPGCFSHVSLALTECAGSYYRQ